VLFLEELCSGGSHAISTASGGTQAYSTASKPLLLLCAKTPFETSADNHSKQIQGHLFPGEAFGPGFPFSCPRDLGMGPARTRGSSLQKPYDAKGFLCDGTSICRHMTADRTKISPFSI
jgi:hypothetical protein